MQINFLFAVFWYTIPAYIYFKPLFKFTIDIWVIFNCTELNKKFANKSVFNGLEKTFDVLTRGRCGNT